MSDEAPLQIVTTSEDEDTTSLGSDGEEATVHNHSNSLNKNNSNNTCQNGLIGHSEVSDSDSRLKEPVIDNFISDKKEQQLWSFNKQLKTFVIKQVKRPGRGRLYS